MATNVKTSATMFCELVEFVMKWELVTREEAETLALEMFMTLQRKILGFLTP